MIDAYHNMSAPPRSSIQKVVRPIGEGIVAGLDIDSALFHPLIAIPPENFEERSRWLDDFVRAHKGELAAVRRPTGYIIPREATAYEEKSCPRAGVMLSLSLLGRMSGGIYIPGRDIRYGHHIFESYVFPAKFFPKPVIKGMPT